MLKGRVCSKLYLSLILLASFTSNQSQAACAPNGDITGANVTTITLGVASCTTLGNTATVQPGATVTVAGTGILGPSPNAWNVINRGLINCTGPGIDLQSGGSITNETTIISTASNAIQSEMAARVTVTNSGSITGNISGALLLGGADFTNAVGASISGNFTGISFSANGPSGGTPSTLDNAGSISSLSGFNSAVVLGRGGSVINRATGTIDATGVGIATAMNVSTVENFGRIGTISTSTGVGLGAGGTVTNHLDGQIFGNSRGVDVSGGDGIVNNDGTIVSFFARGISLNAGGTVNNSATGIIFGGSRGIFIDSGVGTVVNDGSVTGTSPFAAIEIIQSFGNVTNRGAINGDVLFTRSNDNFLMTAGTMFGNLLMGLFGSETATFIGVTDANIGGITQFNGGGGGHNLLNFINSQHTGGSDMVNWETITLQSSLLTLSSNLTLGGVVIGDPTATLNILNSTLAAGAGANPIINSTFSNALVNNAGLINLTNGSSGPNDSLTIRGRYVGLNGALALDTFLGGDGSPSDKLVLDGSDGPSNVTGSTSVIIQNAGGPGAQTNRGILVIEGINGATTGTEGSAFFLAGVVRAGSYEYRLFKGAFDPADSENWFLRSTFSPENLPSSNSIRILGPELSVYPLVDPSMLHLSLLTLGTLHERVGEERFSCHHPCNSNFLNGVWIRTFGEPTHYRYQNIAQPHGDEQIHGVQIGMDVMRLENACHRDYFGVTYAYSHLENHIYGLVTNPETTRHIDVRTGDVGLHSETVGAYWTHFGPCGWYVDTVVQHSTPYGSAQATRANIYLRGHTNTASAEAGYPLAVANRILIEPEAQLIYSRSHFHDSIDQFSPILFNSCSHVIGRLGLRAGQTYTHGQALWQPYIKANVWDNFRGRSNVNFGSPDDNVPVHYAMAWGEIGAGITVRANRNLSLYSEVSANRSFNQRDKHFSSTRGDVGLRLNW